MKNKRYPILFIVFILMTLNLIGCQTTREVRLMGTFNEEEFKKALEPTGKNTVKGSALIRQLNGGVQTCAGFDVAIIPVVPYSAERINGMYGNTEKGYFSIEGSQSKVKFVPDSKEYYKLVRANKCNAQGFFSFDMLKDGEYFVTTGIQWLLVQGLTPSLSSYGGGYLFQKVKVSGGEMKEVILSP